MNKDICEISIIGPACREHFLPRLAAGPLANLGVTLAGVSDLKEQYCMSRPHPDFCLLLGTLAGRARLITPDHEHVLRAGELLIAPAGTAHRYELIQGRPWRIVWFHLAAEVPVSGLRILNINVLPRLAREMLDTIGEASVNSFLSDEARLAKEQYLQVLLRRLLHVPRRTLDTLHEQCLQRLWRTVLGDLARPWTLEELAGLAGYSVGHLNRLCRQYYGHAAGYHLTRLRMDYAAQLLAQGVLKIRTIADRCGYENPFAFSVAFKRRFGLSPGRYREKDRDRRVDTPVHN